MEEIICQLLMQGKIVTRTIGSYKCGALYTDANEALHKDIVRGELFQFLTLEPKCPQHQLPCREYRAKSTL